MGRKPRKYAVVDKLTGEITAICDGVRDVERVTGINWRGVSHMCIERILSTGWDLVRYAEDVGVEDYSDRVANVPVLVYNANDRTLHAWPNVAACADELGVHQDTVKRSIRRNEPFGKPFTGYARFAPRMGRYKGVVRHG